MNFLADEGVEREIVDALRSQGHDVLYVAEMSPGINDGEVLDLANKASSILITSDKDFGDLGTSASFRKDAASISPLRRSDTMPQGWITSIQIHDHESWQRSGREETVRPNGGFAVLWYALASVVGACTRLNCMADLILCLTANALPYLLMAAIGTPAQIAEDPHCQISIIGPGNYSGTLTGIRRLVRSCAMQVGECSEFGSMN